jgi:alkylation response protein AidB-like acyl-CoA dehydrogenase
LPFTEIEALASLVYGQLPYQTIWWCRSFQPYRCQSDCAFSGVDGSIGQIPQNHFYALEVLRNTGTEAQNNVLEVLQGARFGNALAEFKTKTSAHKQTNIRPNENGYLIQGEKFYCTGSLFAHRIPTLVKDETGEFWPLYNAVKVRTD